MDSMFLSIQSIKDGRGKDRFLHKFSTVSRIGLLYKGQRELFSTGRVANYQAIHKTSLSLFTTPKLCTVKVDQ